MAGADLNLSRRALLGAACAAPVLSVVEGPVAGAASPFRHTGLDPAPAFASGAGKEGNGAAGDRRAALWDAALARFRRAEAALAVADGADEDRFGRLASRCDAAICRLLRTPAPDAAALAVKLELATRHLVWEFPGGETCLAALVRDARRLARRAGP